jgi:hypothetical protein
LLHDAGKHTWIEWRCYPPNTYDSPAAAHAFARFGTAERDQWIVSTETAASKAGRAK